jgi:Na+/citrate or Na+/malate symporter
MSEQKKGVQLFGMPWHMFAIFSVVVLVCTYLGKLPKGMVGAFPLMIVLGTIFMKIGDNAPIIKTYLGGGAIVCIFGSAFLSTQFGADKFMVLPEYAVKIMNNFEVGEGFLDFYIAALITGSIMGMNRKLLIKAAVRYLPAILGGVICALGLVGLFGTIMGYGGQKAILFIGIPIMGGGMGAGAVPLSQIFVA